MPNGYPSLQSTSPRDNAQRQLKGCDGRLPVQAKRPCGRAAGAEYNAAMRFVLHLSDFFLNDFYICFLRLLDAEMDGRSLMILEE